MALFPSVFLAGLAVAFLVPGALGRPVLAPIVIALLAASAALVVVVRSSDLEIDNERVSVRFLSARRTTMDWREVTAATYQMLYPSISFGLRLRGTRGRKLAIHAGWWEREEAVFSIAARRLLELEVPMDKATALLVAHATGEPAPSAQIIHRPLLHAARARRPERDVRPASLAAASVVVGIVLIIGIATRGDSLLVFSVLVVLGVASGFLAGPPKKSATESVRILLRAALAIVPLAFFIATVGPPAGAYILGFVIGLAVRRA
jgi:hypothetical protein